MNINITARHCEVSDELRERAGAVITRLGTQQDGLIEGIVVFDIGPTTAIAELRLRGERGDRLVARGEAGDHRSALDRAEDKIRRQIERGVAFRRARRSRDLV